MITAIEARRATSGRAVRSLINAMGPVLLPFVVSRSLVLIVAAVLEWLLDSGLAHKYAYIGDAPLATLSATFDANWYNDIAANGYSASPDLSQPHNYHFFPLYPFLMRLSGDLTGLGQLHGGYGLAGLILSHLFFFLALFMLYQ